MFRKNRSITNRVKPKNCVSFFYSFSSSNKKKKKKYERIAVQLITDVSGFDLCRNKKERFRVNDLDFRALPWQAQ